MNLAVCLVTPDRSDRPINDLVLAAVRGGAGVVQLRDKSATEAEMTVVARRIPSLLAPFRVRLIINDRVEVMLASGAEGLHIGQTDAPAEQMRRVIGPDRIVGLTIETLAQLAALPTGVVDHIGVGPVRATATKPDHTTPLGFDGLAVVVRAAQVPSVAIGGIGLADVAAVKSTGAAGMAIVSADDPEKATLAFVNAWRAA